MPNISIKKEKLDNNEPLQTSNDPGSARIISLKSAKAQNTKGKASNKKLNNIKVKTLAEIKQERKKTTDSLEGASTSSTPTCTNTRKNPKHSHPLRTLSVPVSFIHLPNGFPGKRTFRVSSLPNSVTIKKEPVDDSYSTETPVNFVAPIVNIKQEPEDTSLYSNGEHNHNQTNDEAYEQESYQSTEGKDYPSTANDGLSDMNSENSSYDYLSSSVDFSDVPRCTNQDEDSMSLFAENDTFEEESEGDFTTRQSGHISRRVSQSDDLRETIQQNRASNALQNNEQHMHIEQGEGTSNKYHNIEKKRQNFKNGPKARKNKFEKKMSKKEVAKLEKKERQYMEEVQRSQQLYNMVKGYTLGTNTVKRGVIPQKQPPNVLDTSSITIDKTMQGTDIRLPVTLQQNEPSEEMAQQLKRRPVVPGGRGFFEDVPSLQNSGIHYFDSNDQQTTGKHLNGNIEHNNRQRIFKDKDTNENIFNNLAKKKQNNMKRRSEEDTNIENIDQPAKQTSKRTKHNSKNKEEEKPKQVYCSSQMRTGTCSFAFCKFRHLTERQLEEYKKTGRIFDEGHCEETYEALDETRSQDVRPTHDVFFDSMNSTHSHPESSEPESDNCIDDKQPMGLQRDEVSEDESDKMFKGLTVAASQAMDTMRLNEAWKLIYHLFEAAPLKHPMLIPLVERILVLCGGDNVDPDIAAQVSSKAFDLIPKVRGDYNRHDFTNLMRCLCHTGQYFRAYEALDEMRSLGLIPTHDVFLDLINSSHAHPARAFDLLDEIRSLGLLRTSICSALILMSCKSDVPLIGRTWALFREMIENSIKPSKESFLALLDLLTDNYEGEKLLDALVLYDDNSIEPSPKCNQFVVKLSKDNSEMVSQCVKTVSETQDPQLDVETWNVLLSNCYSSKFNLAIKAQQVQQLMKSRNIPFLAQGYNGLLCSLSEANLSMSLMEVIRDMLNDNITFSECKQGLTAAVNSLARVKHLDELEHLIFVMLDHGIMVEESPILAVLHAWETSKSYEKIYSIYTKCEKAKLTLSIACFRKIYLSLEKWVQNPAASLDVYAAMKVAYPIIPESSDTAQTETSPVQRIPKKLICKYFRAGKCTFGARCRFAHIDPSAADEGAASLSTERSNPFVLRNKSTNDQLPTPLPPPPPPPHPFTLINPVIPSGAFPPVGPFYWKDPSVYGFSSLATNFNERFPAPVSAPTPEPIHAPDDDLSCETKQETMSVDEDQNIGDFKKEIELYKSRIQKSTEDQNFEELARIYVEIKNDKVPVCKDMLQLFYSSFKTFNNIGESLSGFVAIIDIELDNPDSDELESQESLDSEDHKFIGELGVALMQLCRDVNRLDEGYLVLHILHQYGINYFQYPATFIPNEKVLSSPSVALLAADMCLRLEKDPQFDGAVEVLRGCNFALPQEGSVLSNEEAAKRRDTIQKITTHYLNIKDYNVVYEFLQHIGDHDTFGMANIKTIYNKLLKGYIEEKKVEDALQVIRHMESELISRDTEVLRSLVTCLGSIGRFLQAKEIFKSSCLQGAYPSFSHGEELWHATIWASFSKFEIQFYLEHHLQLLNRHVQQQRAASQMPYDEKHLKILRITITDEEPLSITSLDVVKEIQEGIIEILSSEFNPPLSCGISNVVGEVVVNPRSLKRWFIANPSPESQQLTLDSSNNQQHQRNVLASEGNISVRVNVQRSSSRDSTEADRTMMEKVRHTICGHLTRYLREGVIATKDEFKRYARLILDDFKQQRGVPTEYDKPQRNEVISFVDTYFHQAISNF